MGDHKISNLTPNKHTDFRVKEEKNTSKIYEGLLVLKGASQHKASNCSSLQIEPENLNNVRRRIKSEVTD